MSRSRTDNRSERGQPWLKRVAHSRSGAESEAGDTLIEILLATAIITIVASALLGALITALASSSEHRHLSQDDTLLRSMAEALKATIEQNNGYVPCATTTSYTVLGPPEPLSGPTGASGTDVIVFGLGFPASTSVSSVTVGGMQATIISGAMTDANGSLATTFMAPAGGPIQVKVGSKTVTSNTPFTSTGTGVGNGLPSEEGYTIGFSPNPPTPPIQFWNSTTGTGSFTSGTPASCPASDNNLQQITLQAFSSGGVVQDLAFVVRNPTG